MFAAHAAMALAAAGEHDRTVRLQRDLETVEDQVLGFQERVDTAVTLQRSLLSPLPDLGRYQLAARYVPASGRAEVGGDWYDAFLLSDSAVALVVGDVTGHDTRAAIEMGQLRTALRTLALDRQERPGELIQRFDRVAGRLGLSDVATCVYGVLRLPAGDPATVGVRQRRPSSTPSRHQRRQQVPGDPGPPPAGPELGNAAVHHRRGTTAGLHAGPLHGRAGGAPRCGSEPRAGAPASRGDGLPGKERGGPLRRRRRRARSRPSDDVCVLALLVPGRG